MLPGCPAECPACLPYPALGCYKGLPMVSRFERYQDTADANACQRCSDWSHLLRSGSPIRELVSYMVFKRTNGKLGEADGKTQAQPSQDSKGAPRSR